MLTGTDSFPVDGLACSPDNKHRAPVEASALRPIGWEGIGLSVPPDWHALSIARRYLLLGDRVPQLELRWEDRCRHGRRKPARSLRSLQRELRSRHGGGLRLEPHVPGDVFDELQTRFQVESFVWHAREASGWGSLLSSRGGEGVCLVRGFDTQPCAQWRKIGASLNFQACDQDRLWSLFDIRVQLPASLRLTEHLFAPGHFTIAFSANGWSLRLLRWAPADALLADGEMLRLLPERERERASQASGCWRITPHEARWVPVRSDRSDWFSWLPILKPQRLQQGRIWHLTRSNRILGALAWGPRVPAAVFESICASYETC